jgi:hypothetical protein
VRDDSYVADTIEVCHSFSPGRVSDRRRRLGSPKGGPPSSCEDPYELYRIAVAVKRALLFFTVLIGLGAAGARAEESPLPWLEAHRREAGVAPVSFDPVLALAAERWAAALAEAGTLSHRGDDGSGPLDRYRAAGGTDARVGEILGAGPTLADVQKGWLQSGEHRALALGPSWTHAGWGMSRRGGAEVWVVLFCERLVRGLALERGPEGLRVSGEMVLTGPGMPLLYAGLDPLQPRTWDPVSRLFAFLVPDDAPAGYLRLGLVSPAGTFRITNAFTLPPGMERPGATSRSSGSAASP